MKENQAKLEEAFSLLRRALEIHKFASFRERFASVEQWKEEGPHLKKQAYIAWLSAKISIMSNKDMFDNYIEQNKSSIADSDLHNFESAVKVTEAEMSQEFEKQILRNSSK